MCSLWLLFLFILLLTTSSSLSFWLLIEFIVDNKLIVDVGTTKYLITFSSPPPIIVLLFNDSMQFKLHPSNYGLPTSFHIFLVLIIGYVDADHDGTGTHNL